MKKLIFALLGVLFYSGLQAETLKTKQVDNGGTGMFKAISGNTADRC